MSANGPPQILVYQSVGPIDEVIERFARHGVVAVGMPNRHVDGERPARITGSDLVTAAQGCTAIIGLSAAVLDRAVLASLPVLKYIIKIGIGYETIDLDAASDLGILVTNTPAPEEIVAVAEHTIALMLACLKRLDFYTRQRIQLTWPTDDTVYAQNLHGRTVGIIGFGRIGKAVATRLQGWDVRLLAYDREPIAPEWGAHPTTLDALLRESDVVTLHASADHNLAHPLLDATRLALMKPHAVLINTARGALIDQTALEAMLHDGRIGAAGLDVFDPQPPEPDDPLLTSPHLIATPHSAAWVREVGVALQEMAIDNAVQLLAGRYPPSILNPEATAASRCGVRR